MYSIGTIRRQRRRGAPVASGGTKTTVGAFTYHTFTVTSNIVFNVGGAISVMIIGGGGGGGHGTGGGGGAGGAVLLGFVVDPGTYTITVGTGGAGSPVQGAGGPYGGGSPQPATVGNQSSAFGYIAPGGGAGGSIGLGGDGGSGGGGFYQQAGGLATQDSYSGRGFGFPGGAANTNWGGGGGGAGGPGGFTTGYVGSTGEAGNGIIAYFGPTTSTGGLSYYAGGGYASGVPDRAIGSGDFAIGGIYNKNTTTTYGGGFGSYSSPGWRQDNRRDGSNGRPNSGGGGGGGGAGGGAYYFYWGLGGTGGDGLVVIKYSTK